MKFERAALDGLASTPIGSSQPESHHMESSRPSQSSFESRARLP
jgi:hypothetical protein